MMRGRKAFFWIGSVVGGVLLLLCVLLLAAPLIINLDGVHGEIEARFDQETGGQGTFQKLDLFFFPRPHAVIRGGKLSFPGKESLVFEALTVYPKLLPMLKGEFLPARVQFFSPRTDIDLSSPNKDKQPPTPVPETVVKLQMPEAIRNWIEKQYGYFRPYVKDVIYRYLDCGDLHNGFARVKCGECGHEYLLAFSCKKRHFCPSCAAKQMSLGASEESGRIR